VLGYLFPQFPFKHFTLSILFLEVVVYLVIIGRKTPNIGIE
jgi:hypothetical protein